MPEVNNNLAADASAKSASFAAGLMAAISNKFGDGTNSTLFSSFLSSASTSLASTEKSAAVSSPSGSNTNTGFVSGNLTNNIGFRTNVSRSTLPAADLSALRNLAARLQTFIANYKKTLTESQHAGASGSATTATTSASSVPSSSVTTAVGTTSSSSTTATADTTSSTDSTAETSSGDDLLQNVLNLLASLQQIVQAATTSLPVTIAAGSSVAAADTATAGETGSSDLMSPAASGSDAAPTTLLDTASAPNSGQLADLTGALSTSQAPLDPSATLDPPSLKDALKDVISLLQAVEKQLPEAIAIAQNPPTPSSLSATTEASISAVNTTVVSAGITSKGSVPAVETSQIVSLVGSVDAMLQKISSSLKALGEFSAKKISSASAVSESTSTTSTTSSSSAALSYTDTSETATTSLEAKSSNNFDFHGSALSSDLPAAPAFVPASVLFANIAAKSTSSDRNEQTDSDMDVNGADATDVSENPLLSAGEGSVNSTSVDFATQVAALRTASAGTPSAVEQVVLQLNRSAKAGDSQISLELHPADLGKITIKLDFSDDGKVQGTVVANNPATLDLLHKDVRSLERALQDAGLRADPGSLQFSLGGQQQNNSSNQASTNTGSNSASGGTDNSGVTMLSDSDDIAEETYYLTPGGVNMKV